MNRCKKIMDKHGMATPRECAICGRGPCPGDQPVERDAEREAPPVLGAYEPPLWQLNGA